MQSNLHLAVHFLLKERLAVLLVRWSQYTVNTFQCEASFTLPSIAVTGSLHIPLPPTHKELCHLIYETIPEICNQNRDTLYVHGFKIY